MIIKFFYTFLAIYNFDGKVRYGLSLEIGETVQMQEECPNKGG